jgi:hypothetical protein
MPVNIMVLYAPGCFGSHIANLMSLDPRFPTSFDIEGYATGPVNAHHGRPTLIDVVLQHTHDTRTFLAQNNVWAEHVSAVLHNEPIKKFVDELNDKFFLVINLPKLDSVIYRRMVQIGFTASPLAYNEIEYVYTPNCCSRLLGYPNERFWNINPDLIWQPDVEPLLSHLKNSAPLNLDFDNELCQNLHSKWYDSVSKSLI